MQEEKQNDVMIKMNKLLAVLDEHIDAHPTCCLKNVLRSFYGDKFES